MPTYTQIVDFGDKDGLTTGDPNKLIRGTEIDAELTAIATAIGQAQDDVGTNIASGLLLLDGNAQILQAQLPDDPEFDTIALTNSGSAAPISHAAALTTGGRAYQTILDTDQADAIRWRWQTESTLSLALRAGSGAVGAETFDPVFTISHTTQIADFDQTPTVAGTDVVLATDVASTTAQGVIELATQAEVDAESDTSRAVTPDTLGNYYGGRITVDEKTADYIVDTDDLNKLIVLTGAVDRTFTFGSNLDGFATGDTIYVASRDTATLTIAVSGSTLTSKNSSGAGTQDVSPGGMAALINVNGGLEWMLAGDLA